MKNMNRNELEAILLNIYHEELRDLFDNPGQGPLFDPPVMGVAGAEDPFFYRFKEIIGPFHWTPFELLEKHHPGARAKTVISWSLPTPEPVRISNRKEVLYPSREWSYHRTFGEQMNERIRLRMVHALSTAGFAAATSHFDPDNRTLRREVVGWTSRWSERHVAFTAGLGTFGLSGGLITRKGIAHRLGSVVTDLELTPDTRPYGDNPFAWCLGADGGTCRVCKSRCPVGSIGNSHAERNKDLCHDHDYGAIQENGKKTLFWSGEYGCGLCQTKVPCEFRNPRETEKEP